MMNDNDRQNIEIAIDDAIETVACNEFKRLVSGLRSHDMDDLIYLVGSIQKSLRALKDLERGRLPDYNDWDSVFYLSWYQPGQINLANNLLNRIHGCAKAVDVFGLCNGKTHFIDYGCGSLAMMFALSIHAADFIAQDRTPYDVEIDCIDISPAMMRLGQKTWNKFLDIMNKRHQDHPICVFLENVDFHSHLRVTTLTKQSSDTPSYLSAFHCAYEDNVDHVNFDLSFLIREYNPMGVFLTTNWKKEEVLNRVSPINDYDCYKSMSLEVTPPLFSGELIKTTKLRQKLSSRVQELLSDCDVTGIELPFLRNFLDPPVTWNYPQYVDQVYIRQDDSDDDLPF